MKPAIEGLYIGLPRKITNESGSFVSGIWKDPVSEIYLAKEGIAGDGVANPKFHGGPERVLCVYSSEHYGYWANVCGRQLPPGAFGENLTAAGMLEKDVCIGDIYKIGDAVLQVSQGRDPCYTISRRNEYDPLLSKIIETGYTGFFFRVLEEGWVRRDSEIELLEKHPKQVTIEAANEVLFRDLGNDSAVQELMEIPELAEAWKATLVRRVNKYKQA
ncbi:MOSC domain-containing protein [Paenibacillus alkalitolerans]|uniref:MOSC domain-containing protein n=1 Tax=Paenibacillus alkalitolerans TaxID=2799335 RepID=UPI001F16E3F9|nr:MOSC domain-containing protein [Paenibacillus alkalitolerans]